MIKFGTDGWRAIISDQFTFDNVRIVAKAIAKYIIDNKLDKKPLIVGYDPRFLADKFAEEVVKVMLSYGINCYLTERDTPTPIVAWAIKDKKGCGAVMLTASHNLPEYCGIKFIAEYAGPAFADITKQIEANLSADLKPTGKNNADVERFEPRERYLQYLQTLVDPEAIKKAKLKVVYDPMHGSGRGYFDKLLQELKVDLTEINENRDVLFGGHNPEPDDEYLGELKKLVVEEKADLGLANDGDADRFGIVDEKGKFMSANQIVPLVFNYLVEDKGYKGAVVRSIGTSHLIDRIAEKHKIKVYETPVGFKHIAKLMLDQNIIIGGEESGGLSIKGHIPEKDGLLANLLMVEMLAKKKKPLSELWNDLVKKYGPVYTKKVNLKLTNEKKKALLKRLKENPPIDVAGIKVKETNYVDGAKIILEDGSWFLARPSGTEPVVRIYAEADTLEKLDSIIDNVKTLI